MKNYGLLILCSLASSTFCVPGLRRSKINSNVFPMVTREEWGARPPNGVAHLALPVPYVVVHHSSVPGACRNREECAHAMRAMQDDHQFSQNWADIGYNFAVGGDGLVYEGRGWASVGAHAPQYNFMSIGIVLIGHWVSELPLENQLQAAKDLIAEGVRHGYIDQDYSLIGHRQVRDTECPGEALYMHISTWDHFNSDIKYDNSIK